MKSDELDKLLDSALSCYSVAEPSPGFEKRLLNRIQRARSRFFARWMFAIPAFACVFVLVFVFWPKRSAVPPMEVARHIPVPAVHSVPNERRPEVSRTAAPVKLARKEQFPSPAPLTEDERALLNFAIRAPSEAIKFSKREAESSIEPIKIEEIQIQPLRSSD
jgi:hypothetical protein